MHAGHGDVVVLDERDAVADGRIAGEAHDLGDHLLAEIVGGVGLAGEDQLERPLLVEEQGPQPIGLGQQQRRPLVGGEAPGEADDQEARVEDVVGPGRVADRHAAVLQRLAQPLPHEADQGVAALVAGSPQLVVAGVVDAGPLVRPGVVPSRGDVLGEEVVHLRRTPRSARARRW